MCEVLDKIEARGIEKGREELLKQLKEAGVVPNFDISSLKNSNTNSSVTRSPVKVSF